MGMKQRSRKSLKITDAVVRGEKDYYEFEVFPITTEFEAQPAVYIFSRRKIDKTGRGHQKFLHIGQTTSLDGDFAKYKKFFATKSKANVICVRIEDEENLRSKIEEEVKAAHNISCSNEIETVKNATAKSSQLKLKSDKSSQAEKPIFRQQSSKLKISNQALKSKSEKPQNEVSPVKIKSPKATQKNLPVKTKASKSEIQRLAQRTATQKRKIKNTIVKSKSLPRKKMPQSPDIAKTVAAKNKILIKNPASKTAAKNTKTVAAKSKILKTEKAKTAKNTPAKNLKAIQAVKGGKQTVSAVKSKVSPSAAPKKTKASGGAQKAAIQKTAVKNVKNPKGAEKHSVKNRQDAAKKRKTVAKKPSAKIKSQSAKPTSRKQLAF